jgi:hypothetical protein
MTPFEEVYGKNISSIISYMPGVSKVHEVEKHLTVREAILHTLKDNLVLAQNHMKKQVDQGRSKCRFVEGDQVFLRLQPYKKNSLKDKHYQKLDPKFYGPYAILKCVGPVTFQLTLPNDSKLHRVFHVSYLKKVIGTKCKTQTCLPELDEEGSIWLHPKNYWTNVNVVSVSAPSEKC